MPSNVLFAPMAYTRYEASQTLPEKFSRLLEKSGLGDKVNGKSVAIKMHVGSGITYSTIPPVFVRKLVDFVHKHGGDCFITDHYVYRRHPEERGYTESNLGCPVLDDCGHLGKYFYTKEVSYKTFQHVDVAGLIHDADFLIDFSHVKGHGACGFGGACKNIAMGCVTDRTRHEIHALEGGLVWNEEKCVHCGKCIDACNHFANSFDENGKYSVRYHHCTMCQHCLKVCPVGAITLDSHDYADFQTGMAVCTKAVLDTFAPGNAYYINVLTNITAPLRLLGHDHARHGAGHRHHGLGGHRRHRAREPGRHQDGGPDPCGRSGRDGALRPRPPLRAASRQEPLHPAAKVGGAGPGHAGIRHHDRKVIPAPPKRNEKKANASAANLHSRNANLRPPYF